MSAVAYIGCLSGACICVAFGLVRIGSWVIDHREEQGTKTIREAAFVAQARAEVRNV